MWSEHCSYKSSRLHLKKLPTRGKLVVQGPGENAGIIDIGGGYVIAFKIESHNHPSFIEPFQGAATGVGGILRDIFTMGARPIAVMDSLRFGRLDGTAERARATGAFWAAWSSGIAHYGNCFGVPTVGGECIFESCYDGNPLVNVFALGVCRKEDVFYAQGRRRRQSGDLRGRAHRARRHPRRVHGVAPNSPKNPSRSGPTCRWAIRSWKSCCWKPASRPCRPAPSWAFRTWARPASPAPPAKWAAAAKSGIEIELDRVPQRETGMTPYEIMLSESQERMLLVADKGREDEVFGVFRKWGLEAVEIGTVTNDGKLRVRHHGERRRRDSQSRTGRRSAVLRPSAHVAACARRPWKRRRLPAADLQSALPALLASGDLCSKRWIWEQYDYLVRTNTIAGPGADAAIVRIKETGTSVAMSLDGNGRYCYLSPREGAKLAVAESCRNLSTVGAQPVAATNCLNFGNPERPEIMAQLVEAIEGMSEACRFFDTPITGGNVSLYNETLGEGIYPTPVIGIVGLMKTAQPTGIAFRNPGRTVILLGGIGPVRRAALRRHAIRQGDREPALGTAAGARYGSRKASADGDARNCGAGLAESAHDLSDGGLAVALAECSFGRRSARSIDLDSDLRPELLLFHEAPSRILISTAHPDQVCGHCGEAWCRSAGRGRYN